MTSETGSPAEVETTRRERVGTLTEGSAPPPKQTESQVVVELRDVGVYYGRSQAVGEVSMDIYSNSTTARLGPSGCGKSTLLRCLNRMNDLIPDTKVTGTIAIDGVDIHSKEVDPVQLRRRVGMVFQKPNPFPMSVRENVAFGPKRLGLARGRELDELIERALREAALWDEVKDKMNQPGTALSGGQQQRLCIARVLAVRPDIILMDEPCSALDPIATIKIEDLIRDLSEEYTIIIVTHNMQQAARISHKTAFMLAGDDRIGRLIEYADTDTIFLNPQDERTEDYITGRFG